MQHMNGIWICRQREREREAAEGAPVCKFWLKGSCKFGEGCRSVHLVCTL